ncbi:transcription termination factor NusA [Opitutaceae bacterium TAV4]|uniref:transcription termination factor NusA n=1 Tax=Geminisphaera colitermitum TaxID=1148786 RepID=UPI0005BCA8D7|nr:transcription termination factor NusA [Geminisphaera colitermitum]RRJ95424.1 transcription termination factor NusA [Opitutaceae bacterium TAV4]RRJ99607.1 transcription termination factor NusA [Opitutaceae bacterium TAV3]
MSSEILSVLEYMEKEKGIARDDMIAAIVNAIKAAAQKGVGAGQDLKIEINPRNGQLHAWQILKVVDSVGDPKLEIHIEKAQAIKPGALLGDIIEKEVDPASLGRIAAQTARQAVMQKLRQFEKDRIYDDYKDMVGNIITGTVRRRERNDIFIDLGKAEAVLTGKEQVPGEEYQAGDRIRCLLLAIDSTPRGPELILSRASPKFVRRLFEVEVAEIADGTVKIEAFAREPGYRTKIAVTSTDPKVDPVGACVGARGARVKTIVRELNGEKIDIVNWHPEPRQMVIEALKPAVPREMILDEKSHRMLIRVAAEDLALAIGRKGQNARLTSRLIGWRLDIEEYKVETIDPRTAAIRLLVQTFGIAQNLAERLVAVGINSPAAFEGVDEEDLTESGFTPGEASEIIRRVSSAA